MNSFDDSRQATELKTNNPVVIVSAGQGKYLVCPAPCLIMPPPGSKSFLGIEAVSKYLEQHFPPYVTQSGKK